MGSCSKSRVWSYTSHLFLVLWNKLSSWSKAQQLAGDLHPRDLFVSMNSVHPTGSGYIVSALAIAIVVAMSLETAAAVQASLLLRCGDIETNPGPLMKEDFEKVDNSHVLTEGDLSDICQEVVGIESRYYQLGIALGLLSGQLDSIRTAYHQLIDQAFYQMLLLWLRQSYDYRRHGPPTWRRLVEAVDSPNGGRNTALAMSIANRHPVSGTTESVNHPSGHSGSASQQTIVQVRNTSFTPQQVSGYQTLNFGAANYNVPPPTAPISHYGHGQGPPSYNQQPPAVMNCAGNFSRIPSPFPPTTVPPPRVSPIPYPNPPRGAPIPYLIPPHPQPHPSPSYWTGRAGPFQPPYQYPPYYHPAHPLGYNMTLHNMHNWPQGGSFHYDFPQGHDQYHNMPYNPTIHAPHSVLEEEQAPPLKKRKPPIGQVQLSTDMGWHLDHWQRKLAGSYLAQESKSDAWPPLKIVNFVQLALVQQEKRAWHLDLNTIENNIDEVYGHKVNVIYDDLFQNLDHTSLLLVEGRPGSGKTTLLVRISCDWAKGKIMKSKLIIFVRLRYLDKSREIHLHNLLRAACCALTPEDISGLSSYIDVGLGEDVVFLLDGFDEYGIGADKDNLICNLIQGKIFSKSIVILSSRPAAAQDFRQIATKWIEVVGFMKEEVMQYIQTYYEHDKEKALQLEQHLNKHTNVLNLCYLPIHCAMLVHLHEQELFLPETETEFYRYFTLSSIFRTISKHTKHIDKLTSFDQLLPKEKLIFDKTCHLAYTATVESQQVFEKSEISGICGDIGSINDKENPGLLVIDRCLATVGYDNKYSFLHLTLQEYLSALYIAGQENSEQISIVATHSDKKHLYVTWRFLFGILDYSKKSTVNLFKQIVGATQDNHLLHIQCAYESQHSAACTDVLQLHENKLKFDYIGPFDLSCITYVLNTAKYTTVRLEFFECDFSADNAVALLKGVGDCQLSLTVEGDNEAVQPVLDALGLVLVPGLIELHLVVISGDVSVKSHLKLSSNLHKLRILGIDITNFKEEFRHCPNLEELLISFTSCPLTVLEAIKHCTNLVKLVLSGCGLDISEARVLGQSLRFTSKLHFINLYGNHFGDCGLQAVAKGIKNCKDIKLLQLGDNSLTDESIPYLLELIKSARNLETLNLFHKDEFTPEGKEQINEALADRNSVGDMTELELHFSPKLPIDDTESDVSDQ